MTLFSFQALTIGLLGFVGSKALLCLNCVSEQGLQGCLPIITEHLIQDPVLCLTVRVEYGIFGSKFATTLHLGAGHSTTSFGFNLTTYVAQEDASQLHNKCRSLPTTLLTDSFPKSVNIWNVSVCGCGWNFCNNKKFARLTTPSPSQSKFKRKQTTSQNVSCSWSKMIDAEIRKYTWYGFPYFLPLKCHNCLSFTGLDGCLPILGKIANILQPTSCVTIVMRYESQIMDIPLAQELTARFGLSNNLHGNDSATNKWSNMCESSFPNGISFMEPTHKSLRVFSVQSCQCRGRRYCNCQADQIDPDDDRSAASGTFLAVSPWSLFFGSWLIFLIIM